jgi:hypothetical protein
MTRCLEEKAFLKLNAGIGDNEQRLHLENCALCSQRYERIARELESIASELGQEPPPDLPVNRATALCYKAAPIVAALLFGVLLIWGEIRLVASESLTSLQADDVTDFIQQVSEALFPAAALGQTEVAPADKDFVYVQNALGEECSSECQEFVAGLKNEAEATSGE